MPTLGFLKKKRTKDSNEGNSPIVDSPVTTSSSGPTTGDTNHSATSSQTSYPHSQTSSGKPDDPPSSHQVPQSAGLPDKAYLEKNAEIDQSKLDPQHKSLPTHLEKSSQKVGTIESQMESQANGTIQAGAHPATTTSSSTTTATPMARTTKGKYSLTDFAIQRTLGTGSFGRVHLVQSKHNQRFYAVKVLKKQQVVKMKQVEHTNDERKMLQQVKHAFLITLWGTFQDSKNLYMVMDFVEGGELFSLLRKSQVSDIDFFSYYQYQNYTIFEYMDSLDEKRFPNPVAKFYAAEVTLALDYLHSMNIIYRDLKPENLLLDRHGHLKITDFGFAKEVKDITWTLCGTPDYLAPEVVASKGYNKSVDWWSLGILIFEMLCGFTPFWDGSSPMKIYENILKGRVKYPAYIHPDAQDLLQQLITHDLTKRLGNLHGGSKDVMQHPWFAEVTWERLAKKDIDAPYVPPVRGGVGDASQFDKYAEETEEYGVRGPDPHGHLFTDF